MLVMHNRRVIQGKEDQKSGYGECGNHAILAFPNAIFYTTLKPLHSFPSHHPHALLKLHPPHIAATYKHSSAVSPHPRF